MSVMHTTISAGIFFSETHKKIRQGRGADFVIIATNTMHKVYDVVKDAVKDTVKDTHTILLIHLINGTAERAGNLELSRACFKPMK